MKNVIVKSLIACTLITGGMVVKTANAQVIGSPCIITAGQSVGTCASEATLASLHQYLETGQSRSPMGTLKAKGGLIGQLSVLNTQLASIRKQQQNNMPNEDVRNRALTSQRAILESIEKVTRPITQRDCRAVAGSSGAFGGAGGGGNIGNNSGQAAAEASKYVEPEILTPMTENDYVAKIILSPNNPLYCTAEDAANKVPRCEGGEGELPGANNNPLSMIRAATKDPASKPGNMSIPRPITTKEYQAAIDYIRYSRPMPGPKIRDTVKEEPVAKRFLVLQRRYNSRTMAIIYAFSNIVGESVALPEGHPFIEKVWNGEIGAELKQDFKEIYPNVDLPKIPSEREMLHLLVKRQFAKTLTAQDLAGNEVEYFAKRSLDIDKITAYLNLKLSEKAEWNNVLLAHMLSNDIDPVNREQLVSEASSIQ